MAVRNKLYKHHKSKFVLAMRNFSIGFASVVAIIAIAAIPTYITSGNIAEASATEVTEIKQSSDPISEEQVELLANPTHL